MKLAPSPCRSRQGPQDRLWSSAPECTRIGRGMGCWTLPIFCFAQRAYCCEARLWCAPAVRSIAGCWAGIGAPSLLRRRTPTVFRCLSFQARLIPSASGWWRNPEADRIARDGMTPLGAPAKPLRTLGGAARLWRRRAANNCSLIPRRSADVPPPPAHGTREPRAGPVSTPPGRVLRSSGAHGPKMR